jgi:hypothetical protein
MDRRWFYDIDRDGVLWHDGTPLDDPVFLRGFFARLRRDDERRFADYPWVSVCAGERNYVRAAITPIVFRRFEVQPGAAAPLAGVLFGNGGVEVTFDPGALRRDRQGRLFHRAPVGDVGYLLPAVTQALAERLVEDGDDVVFVDGGHQHRIERLEIA